MVSELEKEMRVGAMIRSISGDVRDSSQETLRGLYMKPGEDEISEVGEVCAKWHWDLIIYSRNVDNVLDYIMIIQFAFKNDINLDEHPEWATLWRQLMRVVLPTQFIKKVETLTQVPRLAVMDKSPSLHKLPQPEKRRMFTEIPW